MLITTTEDVITTTRTTGTTKTTEDVNNDNRDNKDNKKGCWGKARSDFQVCNHEPGQ